MTRHIEHMTPIITVKQPWAALIAAGHKAIRTRTHSRFQGLLGRRTFIHADRGIDPSAQSVAARHLTQQQLSRPQSVAIIATAMMECKTPRFGPILTNIKIIEPIAAVGKLGVWYF